MSNVKNEDLVNQNLGSILLEMGAVSQEHLDQAIRLQKRRLGEILIEEKIVTLDQVAQALSTQASQTKDRRHAFLPVAAAELECLWSFTLQGSQAKALRALQCILVAPVEQVAQKLKKVVDGLNLQFGIQVKFNLQSQIKSIDSAVLDDLLEILMHLIRNSFAHGFESVAERLASGKDPQPQLIVKVSTTSGSIQVELSDDGRGVDENKVREIAKSSGFDPASDLLKLMTIPGLSTANKAGLISGFGRGMDIVQSMVFRSGGSLAMSTTPEKGTKFNVKIPVRFLEIDVFSFSFDNQKWAILAEEIESIEEKIDSAAQSLIPQITEEGPVSYIKDKKGHYWSVGGVLSMQTVFVKTATMAAKNQSRILGTFLSERDLEVSPSNSTIGFLLGLN